jgi:hypothetical protein
MKTIELNFYDEVLQVRAPASFQHLKTLISAKYFLDKEDVDELQYRFIDENVKSSITNNEDYLKALSLPREGNMQIFLEVSEQSKLYLKELENNNPLAKSIDLNEEVSENKSVHSTLSKQEVLRLEILEKERTLKELLEAERIEKENAEEEARKEVLRKEAERLEALRKEAERVEAEKFEQERIANELNSVKSEQEKVEKELLYANIVKAVTENVNKNFEKFSKKILKKTLIETNRIITNGLKKTEKVGNVEKVESKPSKSNVVHPHHTCDGCGVGPIVGPRFHCTVCRNFDFCSTCEENLGDEHKHPFIKFREAVNPFANRQQCFFKRIKERHCSNNGPKEFFNFLGEKAKDIQEIIVNIKPEEIFADLMKVIENNNTNTGKGENKPEVKTDEIVFENNNNIEVINHQNTEQRELEDNFLLVQFSKQLQEIKESFYLGETTDHQILVALSNSAGNIDDAIALLFN